MSVFIKTLSVLCVTGLIIGCSSFPPFNKPETIFKPINTTVINPVPAVISDSYSEAGGSAKYNADQQYLIVMRPAVTGEYVKLGDKPKNIPKKVVPFKSPPPKITVTETKTQSITIFFKFDSYELSEEAKALLKQIGYSDPDVVSVSIAGYADAKGKVDGNILLSKNRADAVVSSLVEAGINSKVITSNGLGSEYAIGDNETLGGRSKNRRVEINIIGAEKTIKTDNQTLTSNGVNNK
jgi:outer membrane protein OmpA-like peptidoglycan-associated protein